MSYRILIRTVVGCLALAASTVAHAVAVIEFDGAKFSVSANSNIGDTISFRYIADFRDITSANTTWWNFEAAGISLDFNNDALVSAPPPPLIKGTIAFDGSNAGATEWVPFIDKLSGGGCTDTTNDAVCLIAKTDSLNLTLLNGKLLYWDFTVKFLDASKVFSDSHNLKFLATDGTLDGKGEWTKKGDLVSKDITIQCCDIPDEPPVVPEPGTLALLGLGLLGLVVSRRRAA